MPVASWKQWWSANSTKAKIAAGSGVIHCEWQIARLNEYFAALLCEIYGYGCNMFPFPINKHFLVDGRFVLMKLSVGNILSQWAVRGVSGVFWWWVGVVSGWIWLVWFFLILVATYQLLVTRGKLWQYVATFGNLWQLWATIDNKWQLVATLWL